MKQRWFATSIILVLIALAVWGQYVIDPLRLQDDLTRSLYQILMLFFLNGEWTLELDELPWQIETVRFFAPLAAITSILLVFASSTRASLANRAARYFTRHIIVCGLDEKSWQFILSCDGTRKLTVIESNPENLLIARARARGIPVFVGDMDSILTSGQAGLVHAADLLLFTEDDGTNVELAIKARDHIKRHQVKDQQLKIHIHLNEFGLARQLERYPKFFAEYSAVEFVFFSVYDLSARLYLSAYPPDLYADVANHDCVHLAIYDFNLLAEKLVSEASLIGQYANGSRLRVSIFDEQATLKKQKYLAENRHIQSICDIEFYDQTALGAASFSDEILDLLPTVTQHIICIESEELSLEAALILRATLLEQRGSNAPIMVRMNQSSGLAQLLESNTGEPEIPDGLYPFGMLEDVLQAENMLTNKLDELARANHQMYIDLAVATAGEDNARYQQSWRDMPQWKRKQNLLKADHWPIRMRALRCVTAQDSCPPVEFTQAEALLQARMEHNRYVATKLYEGWRYGEHRVDAARVNPFLVPWEDLPEAQQHGETTEAIQQAVYFSKHGVAFTQRRFVVGVTGHRFDEAETDTAELKAQLSAQLEMIKRDNPNCRFSVLSPLAEGADRLVARHCMQVLGAELHVVLPLPYDLYVEDFTSDASVEDFKALIGQAECYYELPMKFGNIAELAYTGASNEARNKQYALAGAYIVQRSDQLIAIYDGEPEAGVGGTGQVVRWYEQGNVDAEFRYDNHYYLPPAHHPAIVLKPAVKPASG